ncbi:hypothetical protein BCR42DRAFT_389865 [Absidia repens]|uniref:Uncharacterized protein n=1 Tax=Absidia repens TaxID=90262 RepID=A0A1X2IQV3_9FUNG|nr:hypothetical protein BCR42DRAFT_389865 [Absidia repens]
MTSFRWKGIYRIIFDNKCCNCVYNNHSRYSFSFNIQLDFRKSPKYNYSFYPYADAIMNVKWCRDDTMLLPSSTDGKLRIMDAESQECLETFIGHKSLVKSENLHSTLKVIHRDNNHPTWM